MSEPQGYTQAFVDIMNSKLAQDITNAFAEGEKAERERIIKLLEDNLHDWTSGLHLLNFKVAGIDDLIALIKGETK